jgi:hypothetical protein
VDEANLAHRRYQDQFAGRMLYQNATSWISEPSVAFARKTWWDSLLEMYAPTKSEAYVYLTVVGGGELTESLLQCSPDYIRPQVLVQDKQLLAVILER